MYTANVYRDLQVLYREIRVWGFQIYGDCGHSVYIDIVSHKALTSVLISKSLAELAAEGS